MRAHNPRAPESLVILNKTSSGTDWRRRRRSPWVRPEVELLREAVRGFRRLAIIGNASNPLSVLEMNKLQAITGRLGFQAVPNRKLDSHVLVMQSTKDRAADYTANGLYPARGRRILVQG